jgi:hypothetical protein
MEPFVPDVYCPALKQHLMQSPNHLEQARLESITAQGKEIPLLFNISFMMNSRYLFSMQIASSDISEVLIRKPATNGLVPGETLWHSDMGRRWLFPEPADVGDELQLLSEEILEQQWIDGGLNKEQRVRRTRGISHTYDI